MTEVILVVKLLSQEPSERSEELKKQGYLSIGLVTVRRLWGRLGPSFFPKRES